MCTDLSPSTHPMPFNNKAIIPPDSTERIAQLELEIHRKQSEIDRIKEAAVVGSDAQETAQDADVNENKDNVKEPPNKDNDTNPAHFCKSLGNLIALWEQRLTDNNKKVNNEDESVEENSSCADTLPVTIYTSLSETSDGSLASNDAAAPRRPSLSPRRALSFKNIFGSSSPPNNNKPKSNDLEKTLQERDVKIQDMKMVIQSNIEIIGKMKNFIEQMMATDTDADDDGEEIEAEELVSSEKFSELIEALMSRINKEEAGCCPSLTSSSSRSEEEEGCLLTKTNSLENIVESTGMEKEKLAHLQATVQDLESTISLQGTQNTTLKTELARMQKGLDDMRTSASSTEDEIESLKAEIVTLQIKYDIQNEETLMSQMNFAQEVEGLQRTIHKMKSDVSCDKEMVETLKADILKMHLSSSIKEEDMQDEMEEMRVQLELHDLESFSFSDERL